MELFLFITATTLIIRGFCEQQLFSLFYIDSFCS